MMGPFYASARAGKTLTTCRQQAQQETTNRQGHTTDPLHRARRTLPTRVDLLTDKQNQLLDTGPSNPLGPLHGSRSDLVDISVHHRLLRRQRSEAWKRGVPSAIGSLPSRVPAELPKLRELGWTLKRHSDNAVAFFDTQVSNEPVEAINARVEHLRGIALAARNLEHYTVRPLLHIAGLRSVPNPLQTTKSPFSISSPIAFQ